MAAESSTPPDAATADSYVGSLINLITKSEIRYEGVLLQLDAQQSTILLQNVKLFGTEGRKKDGPQVPPNDTTYGYINFRGSDIKDLQVLSVPHVQSPLALPDDPAIIQSNHPEFPSTALSLAPPGTLEGTTMHQNSQLGLHFPSLQGNLPPNQPMDASGTRISFATVPSVHNDGIVFTNYRPGFTGLPGGTSHSQLHPCTPSSPGLLFHNTTIQQPRQHTSVNAPFSGPPSTLQSSHVPLAILSSEPSTGSVPGNASLSLSTSVVYPDSKWVYSFAITSDAHAVVSPVTEEARSLLGRSPFKIIASDPAMSADGTSSSLRRPLEYSSSGDVKAKSDAKTASASCSQNAENVQRLHKPSILRKHEATSSSHYRNRRHIPGQVYRGMSQPYHSHKGHGQGGHQGNMPNRMALQSFPDYQSYPVYRVRSGDAVSQSVAKFTEDFDFEAMNQKFNKLELWGVLGKNNPSGAEGGKAEEKKGDGSDATDLYGEELPKPDQLPVYRKDDFFDSISCRTLDAKSGREKISCSELKKSNAEAFGDLKPQRDHGNFVSQRTGSSRGSYRGRASDNAGRGRGRTNRSRMT